MKRVMIATGIYAMLTLTANAQYPTIPHDLEAKGDSALGAAILRDKLLPEMGYV